MKYIIYSECWYKPYLNHDFVEEITFEDPDGDGAGFCIEWHDIGDPRGLAPKLVAYDDAWITLRRHPELLDLLARLDNPTPEELINHLKLFLGYEDDTPREK
jgi:hypothetical protein